MNLIPHTAFCLSPKLEQINEHSWNYKLFLIELHCQEDYRFEHLLLLLFFSHCGHHFGPLFLLLFCWPSWTTVIIIVDHCDQNQWPPPKFKLCFCLWHRFGFKRLLYLKTQLCQLDKTQFPERCTDKIQPVFITAIIAISM